jgi:DNA-binding transcriptional ArsR family regulator
VESCGRRAEMSEKEKSRKKMKEVHARILKALDRAPIYEGYTVKELSKDVNMPLPTTRWHLEILEANGRIESSYIGKTRLFKQCAKGAEE